MMKNRSYEISIKMIPPYLLEGNTIKPITLNKLLIL